MGHILIAEDDLTSLEILTGIVRKSGNVPLRVRDGQTAMDFLADNYQVVDVVITDLVMPKMDGRELIRKIRSDPRVENIPILVQSGYLGVYGTTELLDLGASAVIPKPVDSSSLMGYIAHHMPKQK